MKRTIFLFLIVVALLMLAGCGAAQPRFGGTGKQTSSESQLSVESPRMFSQEANEEAEESDIPVDPRESEEILSGTRDFTREKNTAISALDQSRLMREISKYMGVPYAHGGASGEGLDCSAYTMLVYRNALKLSLPRMTGEQSKVGSPVEFDGLKFGDLVFFNTTSEPASHVGIYLGDDLFAHASVSLGVTISSLESSYFKNRYETARRIVEDR
ncbi:MAG: NlpC/P60 family protein [Bacteroidota bacterium]